MRALYVVLDKEAVIATIIVQKLDPETRVSTSFAYQGWAKSRWVMPIIFARANVEVFNAALKLTNYYMSKGYTRLVGVMPQEDVKKIDVHTRA